MHVKMSFLVSASNPLCWQSGVRPIIQVRLDITFRLVGLVRVVRLVRPQRFTEVLILRQKILNPTELQQITG